MKKALSLLCLLYVVALVRGHGYFSSLTIDGTVLREGDCTRPHPDNDYDYPISQVQRTNGLQSADMTCGWLPAASQKANRKCPVNPGSKMVYQFHYEMGLGASDTYIIAPDHRGPCIVYMAKSETGSGPVWFKVFEDGYNQQTKQWCVDKLRAGLGKLNWTIPADLAPGNYLVRAEIIALHEGFELYGAQPYVGCAEVTVGGSQSGTPSSSQMVAFPGAYTATDAGILFDIYTSKNPAYPIPGPKLYVAGTVAASGNVASSTSTSTTGAKASTSTTGPKASTSTTGKKSSSSSTSTTGKAPTPASTTTTTGSSSSTTCTSAQSGYMRCVTSETYQTCANGVWQAVQPCNTATTCHPSGNYIYCY